MLAAAKFLSQVWLTVKADLFSARMTVVLTPDSDVGLSPSNVNIVLQASVATSAASTTNHK